MIGKEKCKIGASIMGRRRSLPAINVATLEKLQQQHPAKGIENYLCSTDFNPDVANSVDGITRISKKQTEKGLIYICRSLRKEHDCSL